MNGNESTAGTLEAPELVFADLSVWLTHEPEQIPFLFENLFPCGIVAGLAGCGGLGKSTFVLELTYSLASGVAIFPDIVPVGPAPVMVLLGEDPEPITRRRLWNIARRFPLERRELSLLKSNLMIYPAKASPLCANEDGVFVSTKMMERLQKEVLENRPALVILDPKSRWAATNENNNDDATRFVTMLENEICSTGASVLLVHHVSKSKKSALETGSARGASAFTDATRLFFSMTSEEGVVYLDTTKANYGGRLSKPITFKHLHEFEGVLEQCMDEAILPMALAEAMAEWFMENGGLNISAIRDPRDDRARDFHEFLKDRFRACRDMLETAIEVGSERGILVVTKVATGGRSAVQINAASNAASDEDESFDTDDEADAA